MNYAIVEISGKQYKVEAGQKLTVAKLNNKEGDKLVLEKVILVCKDGRISIGQPYVAGEKVEATVLGQVKGEKVYVKKYKQKVRYRRKIGFRAKLTDIVITSVCGERVKEKSNIKPVKEEKKVTAKKTIKTAVKKVKKVSKPAKKASKSKK